MKKSILLGACLALTSLAIAPAVAQTQSTTTSTTTNYMPTSTVIGAKIKDSRGQDVGVIKDFVLDRNTGCLAYVVLSTGKDGVLTTSTKTVAAPWAVFSASSDPRVYITRIEREKIYGAPVWESTRIQEYSRTEYLNSVYGYYGVTAPSFNAQLSVGVTNTNTTAAAPTAAASMAPAATPALSPTVRPMPSPQGTPERSPVPPVTAPPSSPKAAPASTRGPVKEKSSPSSTRAESKSEKKTAEEPEKKSEKAIKRETRPEKSESESEPPSKSTKVKKPRSTEPDSATEPASTPNEPREP